MRMIQMGIRDPTSAVARALVLACLSAGSAPVLAAGSADGGAGVRARLAASFQDHMASGAYEGAVQAASSLVELTESSGLRGTSLSMAYQSLARAQMGLGAPAAAETSLHKALELLEESQGFASPRLLQPLADLSAAYEAQGKTAKAVAALDRAVAVSHRSLGLFNREQLALIDRLVPLGQKSGDWDRVDRQLHHAVMVEERAFGFDDPMVLPRLTRLARWYEETDRMELARLEWQRAVHIGESEGGGRNAVTIRGLLGIARTHRLQFVRDPDSVGISTCRVDPATGELMPLTICTDLGRQVKLDEEGEEAALDALRILDSTPEPPEQLLVETLLEVGDWYMTAQDPGRALPHYERAWSLLAGVSADMATNPLSEPRPVYFRPPRVASQYRLPPAAEATGASGASQIEFSLTVGADGAVSEIRPLTEASDARISRLRRALEHARFSPRFVDGQPVSTAGFRYVTEWYEPPSLASSTP